MALSRDDFVAAAKIIGCEPEAVMAVATVESKGGGFDPEGFPKTLFEGHWFSKYTGGKFSAQYPTLSYPKWTRQFYGKTWQEEKQRLATAMTLDRKAAMMAASWGMFQIMGFNCTICGYTDVQKFVNDMCKSEGKQLEIFSNYIVHSGLADELRDKRWADFARLYNGPEFAVNKYDQKLATEYAKAKAKAPAA